MSQTVSPPIYLHWNGHKNMLCWLRYTTSQIMKFKDDGLTWISKSIIFEKALSLSSLSHKSGQSSLGISLVGSCLFPDYLVL